MAKLTDKMQHRQEGNTGRRFLTRRDMAMAKHDEAVKNARVKRGEQKRHRREYIAVCGCGMEGCMIHHGYDPEPGSKKSW